MDLWVVAAAAGAGYLAKYWNKSLNNGDNSHHLSSEDSFFENPESSSCPFSFRKKTQRGELGKDRALDGKSLDGVLTGEVASKRGFNYERLRQCRNYSESDLLSISNLAVPLSPCDDNVNLVEDGNEQNADTFGNNGFFLPEFSAKVVPIHNSFGHKTFIRTKHLPGHTSRPLSSLESCFMAQLYKEHAKMEEYVFSPLSSESMGTRSFVVSNGRRILNRGSKEHTKLHKAGRVQDENIVGVPSLPKIGSSNDTKKVRFDAVVERSRNLNSSNDGGKLINTQHGMFSHLNNTSLECVANIFRSCLCS